MTPLKNDCVFCRIMRGELDAAIVYKDESTMAFLDLRQSNEGHVLVVPRRHFEQIYDLDDDSACALAGTVCKVARAVRRVYSSDGLSIWQSNGPAAYQEVPHVHWHIFPRYTDDGHLVVYPKELAGRARREYPLQSLKNISVPLKKAIEESVE